MRRLTMLLLAAAGLACLAPARGGAPPPPPSGGYTVRPIGAGNQTIKLAGARNVWLRGDGSIRTGRSGINGIQFENCVNCRVSNITLSGWYQAVRGNNSNGLEFLSVVCTKNKQQGFLFANCSNITLRQCEGSKTAVQHSFYAGNISNGKTANVLIEDSTFFGSSLAEVQVNSESGGQVAKNVVIRRTKITNDKFCLNLLGTQGFVLDQCALKSTRKALSLDRPFGRPWPSTGKSIGGSCVGSVYKGSGSSISKQ